MAGPRKMRSGKKRTSKVLETAKTVKVKKTVKRGEPSREISQQIPHGYDIDTIVLMPVNRDTSFIYWEITDRLLNGSRKKLESGSAQLMIKVFEEGGLKEVCSFKVSDRIGNRYVHYQPSLKPFVAEIGVSNGRGFAGLLKSRITSSPGYSSTQPLNKSLKLSSGPSEAGKEIWMTRKEERREFVSMPSGRSSAARSRIMEYYREVGAFNDSSLFSKI